MTRGARRGSGALLTWLLMGTLLLGEARAQAQSFGPVFVQLHAGQRAYTVTPANAPRHAPQPEVAKCEGDCGFWAWPGPYKLHFPGEGAQPATNATLRVRAPGDYTLVPANLPARHAGLALGVVGPIVTVAGVIMLIAGVEDTLCDPEPGSQCKRSTPALAYYGFGTMLAGIGITTVGWVVYAKNGVRFAYSPPSARAATPTSMTARVGLMPLPRGGFGLGAALAF